MTQNTQEAYEDFNEAIKLDPDNGDIFHHRGQVCTKSNHVYVFNDDI
jgi:cytochrome c-type biogenesis protein CcmH/NrfG